MIFFLFQLIHWNDNELGKLTRVHSFHFKKKQINVIFVFIYVFFIDVGSIGLLKYFLIIILVHKFQF